MGCERDAFAVCKEEEAFGGKKSRSPAQPPWPLLPEPAFEVVLESSEPPEPELESPEPELPEPGPLEPDPDDVGVVVVPGPGPEDDPPPSRPLVVGWTTVADVTSPEP